MLKHRTHPKQYNPWHLKVDFSIQLIVKFQILINFLWQMLDFCLGCSNKKCWVWFPAMIFLLLTFLFFWGNHYEAVQPVKTTIFTCRKITFERELAAYWPVFLHYSWIFDSGTLIQIVSAGISSWKLDAWCYFITSDPFLVPVLGLECNKSVLRAMSCPWFYSKNGSDYVAVGSTVTGNNKLFCVVSL